MDQNASNGPSKGSWREKLGLGNGKKDMPKIADEFKPMNDEPKLAAKPPGTAPRPPQPVTKLAPMAPRTPGARSVPTPKTPPAKPAASASSEGLADRLKAQRQAAEKLAEQRISNAREKAEARANESPRATQAPAPADKPKFTFADEEIAAAKRETPTAKDYPPALQKKAPAAPPPPMNGPTVTPPRPTLGGEKPIAATGNAESRRLQPQLSPTSQSSIGYRPLDPPNFQNVLKRGATLPQPTRGFATQRPTFADNGFGETRRREPAEDFRRRPEPTLRGEERPDVLRGETRRPTRGRRGDYDDDMADVFEEEEERPQRRRANARDYNQAYRDYEEGENDEAPRRRSSGPLLILLAILVVAAVFVTGLWYYYFHMKPVTVTGDGQVPVISAPAEPAKVTPEPSQDASSTELSPASTAKKKIYDRILGEADTGGQMVPTEEAPSPVEPAPQPDNSTSTEPTSPGSTTGFNNDSAASPIPEPANGGQTSNDTGMPSPEPLPLPMPPAPGNDGTQGSLPEPAGSQSVVTNDSGAEPPTPATNEAAAMSAKTDPPQAAASRGIAMLDTIDSAATDEQATPPSDNEPAAVAPSEEQPPKAKAKTKTKTAASKPKQQSQTSEAQAPTSGEGLVLVPPSETPPPPAAVSDTMQPLPETAAATTPTTSTGLSTVFGSGAKKLTGKRAENAAATKSSNSASTGTQQQAQATNQQVASVDTQRTTSYSEPEAPASQASRTTTTTTTTGGTGFMAQVASLRSEADARAELDRLRGSHGDLIGGLSTRITKATVAGATRYRLGFGPLPSRGAAAKLCSSLIAAGERDCAVRGL